MQDIVHKNVQQVKGWRIGVGEKSWSGSGRGELELERAGKVLTLLFARPFGALVCVESSPLAKCGIIHVRQEKLNEAEQTGIY